MGESGGAGIERKATANVLNSQLQLPTDAVSPLCFCKIHFNIILPPKLQADDQAIRVTSDILHTLRDKLK